MTLQLKMGLFRAHRQSWSWGLDKHLPEQVRVSDHRDQLKANLPRHHAIVNVGSGAKTRVPWILARWIGVWQIFRQTPIVGNDLGAVRGHDYPRNFRSAVRSPGASSLDKLTCPACGALSSKRRWHAPCSRLACALLQKRGTHPLRKPGKEKSR